MRFFLTTFLASVATALAAPISAQPDSPQRASCAERSALERDMAIARSKGQMVRRQRLEMELDKLDSDCDDARKPLTRREQIDRQQQVISELERELRDARNALRILQTQPP